MNAKVAMALAVSSLTLSAPALAQSRSGVADQYRLSLGTSVISYSSGEVEPEGGVDADTSTTILGLPANVIDLQLSYGLSQSISLGGAFRVKRESTETEQGGTDNEQSELSFLLGPIVDFYFGSNAFSSGTILPFASAGAFFVVESSENGNVETSLSGFSLNAGAGLRWFVASELSLDPVFGLGWTSLSGEQEAGGGSTDLDFSAFNVGISLYISLWL